MNVTRVEFLCDGLILELRGRVISPPLYLERILFGSTVQIVWRPLFQLLDPLHTAFRCIFIRCLLVWQ